MKKPTPYMKTILQVKPAYIVSLVLVLTIFICYRQVRDFDFIIMDDPAYVTENHKVYDGFTRSGVYWAFTSTQAANWHPITWLSHMLDCELFNGESGAHHLMNVFFHLFNSLLLFWLLRRMTGEPWPSSVVAVIFAIHPINVESVAWVAERKNLLCTFFGILTLLAYLRYVKNRRILTYMPVAFFYTFGLMAKPMIVTLPFVMLLLDYWPLNCLPIDPIDPRKKIGADFQRFKAWTQLIPEKVPLFILSFASCAITLFAQKHGGAVATVHALPIGSRISNAIVSYASYIKKMIWPENLAILYPHPISIPASQLVFSVILLGGITLFSILERRRHPYLFVGWFWYMGTLVPVIGMIQVGVQGMADRYAYIAMIGFFMMLVWAVKALFEHWRLRWKMPALLAALLISIYMSVTWRQVGYWHDSIKIFQHTLAVTKDNYAAHNSLGFALYRKGKTKEAIDQYHKSIAIDPVFDPSHVNMGTAFYSQGQLDAAIYHFSEAIRINPKNAEAYNNKGAILAIQGRSDDAIRHYTEALRLNPFYADAHSNLGDASFSKGDYQSAITHYRKSIDINSRNKQVHNNLGIALAALGRLDEAGSHFSKAVQLDRNFKEANHNLHLITFGSVSGNHNRLRGSDHN